MLQLGVNFWKTKKVHMKIIDPSNPVVMSMKEDFRTIPDPSKKESKKGKKTEFTFRNS